VSGLLSFSSLDLKKKKRILVSVLLSFSSLLVGAIQDRYMVEKYVGEMRNVY
jgi:hypothetical protein